MKSISLELLSLAVSGIATKVTSIVSSAISNAQAPSDGNLYGQKDKKWVKIPDQQNVEFATEDDVKKIIEDAFK